MQGEATQQRDSIPAPREDRASITKYDGNHNELTIIFNDLSPPYFFRAVRSFGEYGDERDETRPCRRFRSQELHANKPAYIGDFRSSAIRKRVLQKG
jgi:hypothetical protein